MNLKDEFNRLTGMFDHSVNRMNGMADEIRGEARTAARKAQRRLSEGRERLASLEEMAMETVRQRPQLFVILGICLLGLIIAKVMVDQSERQQDLES
jgi:hypothetical protein